MPAFVNSLTRIARHPGVSIPVGWTRWVVWQLRKLAGRFPTEVTLDRSRMTVTREDMVGALVAWVGLYDYDNMHLLLESLEVDDVFFDVGSNVGSYCLLAAQRISRGRVVAFEPDGIAGKRWEANRSLNNYQTMELHALAVGERDGTVAFPGDSGSSTNAILPGGQGREVPMTTLASFIERTGLRPTVVKIDTEGYEWGVLSGMGVHLDDPRIKYIQLEANGLSELTDWPLAATRRLLEEHGYALYTYSHRRRWLTPLPAGISRSPTGDVVATRQAWLQQMFGDRAVTLEPAG